MNTISSYLEIDHEHCATLFAQVRDAVRARLWKEADLGFADFADALERHLQIEEQVVFGAFEEAVGNAGAATGMLRAEHQSIRGMVRRLSASLEARAPSAYFDHADTLRIVLHAHSEKEEGVLYPLIERVLAARCDELIGAMARFGKVQAMSMSAA